MIGRIGAQPPPIGFLFGEAIVEHPFAARGELVKAQHVHHPDGRVCGGKQIGPLVDDRAHQQAAVGATLDRQPVLGRHAIGLEPFARCDEIIEHVLLGRALAAKVPRLAIFAAAANIGHGIGPARLQPRHARRRKGRKDRDVEAAIAIEDRRHRAAQILAADDKHRNSGTILGRIEHLPRFETRGIERQLGRFPHAGRGRVGRIEAIDRGRLGETAEHEVALRVPRFALHSSHATDAGQRQRSGGFAVKAGEAQFSLYIAQVVQDQLLADDAGTIEHGFVLGHDGCDRRLSARQINPDHLLARRILAGHEPQRIANAVNQAPFVLEQRDERAHRPIALAQRHDAHRIALFAAGAGRDDHPALIVSDGGSVIEARVIRRGIDQFVRRLVGADLVIPHRLVGTDRLKRLTRLGRGEARIDHAAASRPCQRRKLHMFQRFGQDGAGGDIEEFDGAPIRSAVLNGIGKARAVLRWLPIVKRSRTVLGPSVRIDQHTAFTAAIGIADIEHRLVLQARIVAEEQEVARLDRNAIAFEIKQRLQPLFERGAFGQLGEVTGGEAALRLNPRRNLLVLTHIRLKPAIGIGHFLPERRFNHAAALRGGVVHHSLPALRKGWRDKKRGSRRCEQGADRGHGGAFRRVILVAAETSRHSCSRKRT